MDAIFINNLIACPADFSRFLQLGAPIWHINKVISTGENGVF